MDKPQEEMQELGFFGIYKESFKTIFSSKKIFAKITLALILPLSIIFLADFVISDRIFLKIIRDQMDTQRSNGLNEHQRRTLAYAWIGFWIFKIMYLSCLLLFSLLSTSAVVYTIANLYSGNEVTFKKILKIVPKVWKKLALTFLWTYFGFFIYNVIAIFVFVIWKVTHNGRSIFGLVVFCFLIVIYSIGFIYITALWQLASVVTVLESSCGLKAMKKSSTLIEGKRWLSWFVFLVLYCIFAGILLMFDVLMQVVLFGPLLGGIVCLFLLTSLFLLGYVVQTMLYLVCKSYNNEQPIDRVGLSSQLGRYMGEFEPAFTANNDIQLGQPQPHLQV